MELKDYIKKYQDLSKLINKSIENYFSKFINENKLIYDKINFF